MPKIKIGNATATGWFAKDVASTIETTRDWPSGRFETERVSRVQRSDLSPRKEGSSGADSSDDARRRRT